MPATIDLHCRPSTETSSQSIDTQGLTVPLASTDWFTLQLVILPLASPAGTVSPQPIDRHLHQQQHIQHTAPITWHQDLARSTALAAPLAVTATAFDQRTAHTLPMLPERGCGSLPSSVISTAPQH